MATHLVFVGGGHVHLTCLLNIRAFIEAGARVTLISPSEYHYYSGMGPGMLAGTYRPEEIRFHVRKMAEDRGAAFVEDSVISIDPNGRILRLRSGKTISYDIVSFNVGSEIPIPGADAGSSIFAVKPIVNLLHAREAITRSVGQGHAKICVVGGGPAGAELAGNVWRLVRDAGGSAGITLIAGERLLHRFPSRVRALALRSLTDRGITVREACRMKAASEGGILLDDGSMQPCDVALVATGVKPSGLFRDSGVPSSPAGELLVNARLQSVGHPEIFGGGDCIRMEGRDMAKVGVYAVRENPVLFHNLLAAVTGGELQSFEPQQNYLLIFNMGDGRAIFCRKGLVWAGRTAFWLKDSIDRKFMRKFQVSGEVAG